MTILNITAATSGGSAAAQAECWVRLMTGGTYGGAHNGTVIGQKEHFTLDNAGTHTFADGELAPNSEIDPEGTIYHFRVNGGDYYIQLPDSGEYDLSDTTIWTVATPPAFLVEGQQGPPGDLTVESDLVMPPTTVGSGTASGGSIRDAQSLILKDWDYTQTAGPTDPAVGTAVLVTWDAILAGATGIGNPAVATGSFGPRAVFNIEGILTYNTTSGLLAITPIGFGDMTRVMNQAGVAKIINPGWNFMSTPMQIADGATVTLGANDTNEGGASFVCTRGIVTINSGAVDADAVDMTSYLSAPVIVGNVDLRRRIGVDLHGTKFGSDPYILGPSTIADVLDGGNGQPPLDGVVDTGGGEVLEEDVGLRVKPFAHGTHQIGIDNGNAYVATPRTSTIANAASTIRTDGELVLLNVTAGTTLSLTGTPIIADGKDGQRLTIYNAHASHTVTLAGERAGSAVLGTANTNVADTVAIGPSGSATLEFRSSDGLWHVTGTTSPQVVFSPGGLGLYNAVGDRYAAAGMGSLFGAPFISMGPGGATTADVYLTRTAAGAVGVGTAWGGNTGRLNGRTVNPGRTVTGNTTFAATDIGGLVVANSGSAIAFDIPLHATVNTADYDTIRFINRGAGTLTITHTGGTIVTGSTTSFAQGKSGIATRLASNVWQVQ